MGGFWKPGTPLNPPLEAQIRLEESCRFRRHLLQLFVSFSSSVHWSEWRRIKRFFQAYGLAHRSTWACYSPSFPLAKKNFVCRLDDPTNYAFSCFLRHPWSRTFFQQQFVVLFWRTLLRCACRHCKWTRMGIPLGSGPLGSGPTVLGLVIPVCQNE